MTEKTCKNCVYNRPGGLCNRPSTSPCVDYNQWQLRKPAETTEFPKLICGNGGYRLVQTAEEEFRLEYITEDAFGNDSWNTIFQISTIYQDHPYVEMLSYVRGKASYTCSAGIEENDVIAALLSLLTEGTDE